MTKRVVVWGTGFVGKMVIAEIAKHPFFELVGVGVSNPDKVGRDVGEERHRPRVQTALFEASAPTG